MTKPKVVKFGRYEVAEVYIPMFYDKHFIKLFYGSRNSTKTHFACLMKLLRAIELPYFKCLMVRKIKDAVKDSIYETLKTVAHRHGIADQFEFNDHKARITCIANGNTFIPKGTHEVLGSSGNAKGVTDPTDALVDEMDEVTESEYKSLVYSLRGSDDLELIGIFNSKKIDQDHWIFKRWFFPTNVFEKPDGSHTYIRSKRKNTIILHTNYLMNPYVSEQIKEEFEYERQFDYEYYELDGLGMIKTVKTTNMAFKYYSPPQHIDKTIKLNPEMLAYFHWDFNRLPHHTVGLSQPSHYDQAENVFQWNLVTEFCLEDHSISEVVEEIASYLKDNDYNLPEVAIVCDYSGNTKKDHDSITDINKIIKGLRSAGFSVINRTKVNPSVSASLGFVDDIFREKVTLSSRSSYPGAKLRFRVHPSAKFHCDDFKKTKKNNEGGILKVTQRDQFIEDGNKVTRTYQARGHAVDGTRYLFTCVFSEEYTLYKSSFQ